MHKTCPVCTRPFKAPPAGKTCCSKSCAMKLRWKINPNCNGMKLPDGEHERRVKAYQKKYREEHKEYISSLQKKWNKENREKINERTRRRRVNDPEYRKKINDKQRVLALQRARDLREEVLVHYSNGDIKCDCCGERERKFLTLDHIRPFMKTPRKKNDNGTAFYQRLKREGFPLGYQVLCYNCNIARGRFGMCPHRENK